MSEQDEKIKNELQKEREQIEEKIILLKKDDPFSDPDHVMYNAAVDEDVREQESHQRIEVELQTLAHRLKDIAEAMKRLKNGTYGRCKRCNQPIPRKRLELIREAIYCVQCESALTK